MSQKKKSQIGHGYRVDIIDLLLLFEPFGKWIIFYHSILIYKCTWYNFIDVLPTKLVYLFAGFYVTISNMPT